MAEIIKLLGTEVSIPALWLISGALLLAAAGGRSVWPAIAAAVLLAGYYGATGLKLV